MRQAEGKRVTLFTRITKTDRDLLVQVAAARDIFVSDLVRTLLRQSLNYYSDADKKALGVSCA